MIYQMKIKFARCRLKNAILILLKEKVRKKKRKRNESSKIIHIQSG